MKQTKYFEMDILAVFHLNDESNIFSGIIEGDKHQINKMKVNLVIDGETQTLIEVDDMFMTPPSYNGYKAVSTCDEVNLTQEVVDWHDCKLIEVKY